VPHFVKFRKSTFKKEKGAKSEGFMKSQRRKFSEEFKRKVVQEAAQGKVPLSKLALKFELTPRQIRIWQEKQVSGRN
jgi:transposase-like protein